MCGKTYGLVSRSLLLLCLGLCLQSIHAEKPIYLTETEMLELETIIETSKKEVIQLQGNLTTALDMHTQLQLDYIERQIYYQEREKELQKTINRQTTIIQIGSVTIGVAGVIALVASVF